MSNTWKHIIFKASGFNPNNQSLVNFETPQDRQKFHKWVSNNQVVLWLTCLGEVRPSYAIHVMGQSDTETISVLYDTKGVTVRNFENHGNELQAIIILKIKQNKGKKYVYVDVVCGPGFGWFMFYSALELAEKRQINQIRLESVPTAMIVYAKKYGFSVTPKNNKPETRTELTRTLKVKYKKPFKPFNQTKYLRLLGSWGASTNGALLRMQIETPKLREKLNNIGQSKIKLGNYTMNTFVKASQSKLPRKRTTHLKSLIANKERTQRLTLGIRKSLGLLRKGDGRAKPLTIRKRINSLRTPSLKNQLNQNYNAAMRNFRTIKRTIGSKKKLDM